MENPSFLMQLLGTALAAAFGGVAAWVAIRVDVAIAKKIAEDAKQDVEAERARLNEHIERHHTVRQ